LKSLYVAVAAGSTGVYTIAGTSSLTLTNSGNFLFVGNNGNGTFIQSNGTVQTASPAMVGRKPGSVGIYTLLGGLFHPQSLDICEEAGSTGTFNMAGGNVLFDAHSHVGDRGHGTVNQSGGTITAAPGAYWFVGSVSNSVGKHILSGSGSLIFTNSSNYFFIGNEGNGAFVQSNGIVQTAAPVMIGRENGSSGTYIMEGGSFMPASLIICEKTGSAGHLAISGGSMSVESDLSLSQTTGSTGTLHVAGTGATINVNGSFYTANTNSIFHATLVGDNVSPVMVTNGATINGEVRVEIDPLNPPARSAVVTIINSASLSGKFTSTNCIDPLQSVTVIYEDGDVKLTDFQARLGMVILVK